MSDRSNRTSLWALSVFLGLLVPVLPGCAAAQPAPAPDRVSYTAEQAEAGAQAYVSKAG